MKKLLLILILLPLINVAQSNRQRYIDTYKTIAIREMQRYKIPASITLAQGILESGDGQSTLATKANNHFGIKCHQDWTGPKVYHDDDKKDECFRKYKHAEESFEDHSKFLTERSRYAALFKLDRTDYKGWAEGLQKAGYATSKSYAKTLIRIIEENQLHQFDLEGLAGELLPEERILTLPNGAKYIELNAGETLEDVAKLYKRSVKKILKYNDWSWDVTVMEGQRIYIRPKKFRGSDKARKVAANENMHSIAQDEGIKLRCLYWRNRKPVGWQPHTGDYLRLRGRTKN
jgi:hypothetical protein